MKVKSTSKHYQRIRKFMEFAGQDIPEVPVIPDSKIRLLRARLILEEALETVKALGCFASVETGEGPTEVNENSVVVRVNLSSEFLSAGKESVLEGVIDGCCDISVVTIGTLIAFGVPDKPFLREVDAANLRKFEEGGYRREDGKWMKPPGWYPPDIIGILGDLNE